MSSVHDGSEEKSQGGDEVRLSSIFGRSIHVMMDIVQQRTTQQRTSENEEVEEEEHPLEQKERGNVDEEEESRGDVDPPQNTPRASPRDSESILQPMFVEMMLMSPDNMLHRMASSLTFLLLSTGPLVSPGLFKFCFVHKQA